jgi:hypothetical protein
MHATRARLPHKRTRSKKAAAKKAAPQQAHVFAAEALALPPAAAEAGVISLAARRAALAPRRISSCEIHALVEWIAPAREGWRRGELEVRRSACMPVAAQATETGGVSLTELPGQGDPLLIDAAALAALRDGLRPAVQLSLPGLRVTVTLEDLHPVLPVRRPSATLLSFPARS